MCLRELDLSESLRLVTEAVYEGPHISQVHSSHFKGMDEYAEIIIAPAFILVIIT